MSGELKGACIFGQSGGPTAVINASAYGVLKTALESDAITNVYGAAHGIRGVLDDRLYDIAQEDPDELRLLLHTPSSELGSCRYKMADPDTDDTDYRRILEIFRKYNVRYFFYNGGNDSMDTCNKVSKYMMKSGYECRVMGIPKTIDNDLFGTDHCPGFASAAKYIATSCMEIYQDARVYDTGMVCIVEIMGRHAGWVTAASSLARKFEGDNPLLIYMPEAPFEMESFFTDLENALSKSTAVVVCVSEGIRDASGKFICEYSTEAQLDTFGHKMLTGCGKLLESYVRNRFGVKVRSVELNVNQRCSSLLASLTDINEADMAGRTAVKCALEGVTGKMITFNRTDNNEYSLEYGLVDVCDVCNKEKPFPAEWITGNNNDISPEFAKYALPLIKGVPEHVFEDGVPKYLYRK